MSCAFGIQYRYETLQKHTVKYTIRRRSHNTTQSFGKLGYMVECSLKFVPCSDLNFRYCPCSKKTCPWPSGKLTMKLQSIQVCDMTKTYSQIHYTDKFSQHSSITWTVWLNGWMFTYKLSCCRFRSCYSNLNVQFLLTFFFGGCCVHIKE